MRGDKQERMETHGVNNGQALKIAAMRYLVSGNRREELENFRRQLSTLDRYHGMPNGMFTCDEHFAGLEATHGTELCTVVETLYSLEVALATFGDPLIADRIETVTFNALPGTFDDAMWAHQYDQQVNQVQASLNSKPWTTNGPESNLYGLEPNFGCCTANFHQGWPKLALSLWMRSADGGLAACVYAPCHVESAVATGAVRLSIETEYPFRQDVRITVDPEHAGRFPIRLRIPAWATGASIRLNGEAQSVPVQPGTFVPILRHWKAGDVLDLHFPMVPKVSRWNNDAVAITRGPLLFSYSPGQSWVKLRDRGPTADWQVFPLRPWNYALRVDESSAAELSVTEDAIGSHPFAEEGTPVRIRVKGRQLDTWRSEDGVAAPVPRGSQVSSNPEEMLELIPYAAAKLRVTIFPQLTQDATPPGGNLRSGV